MLNFCIYCLSTHSDAYKEISREKKVKLQEKLQEKSTKISAVEMEWNLSISLLHVYHCS